MLSEYIQAGMRHARYDLEEDGSYYGEIPECAGVWAQGHTLEECREALQLALEGWIVVGLRFGDELPPLDGVRATTPEAATTEPV